MYLFISNLHIKHNPQKIYSGTFQLFTSSTIRNTFKHIFFYLISDIYSYDNGVVFLITILRTKNNITFSSLIGGGQMTV